MTRRTALLGLLPALVAATGARADDVERRALVPDADRPHAEVRVVRRDGATVVQTVVLSRALRRVAGTIADKERASWPDGAAGSDDRERYVSALAAIAAAVRAGGEADGERRQSLCIELPESGPVVVSAARVTVAADGWRLVETLEPATTVDVSAWYLARNRALIVADAFGVDEATARSWLEAPGKGVASP